MSVNVICIIDNYQQTYEYIQCITKVSTSLIFLHIFKYTFSCDNTDKMTLWHNEK